MNTLLTTAEIAALYGVTTGTVNYWVSCGAPVEKQKQNRGRYPTSLFDEKKLQSWLDKKYRRKPITRYKGGT